VCAMNPVFIARHKTKMVPLNSAGIDILITVITVPISE
jgi:hypothetical protein